jgi:hypothetical protein
LVILLGPGESVKASGASLSGRSWFSVLTVYAVLAVLAVCPVYAICPVYPSFAGWTDQRHASGPRPVGPLGSIDVPGLDVDVEVVCPTLLGSWGAHAVEKGVPILSVTTVLPVGPRDSRSSILAVTTVASVGAV